MIKRNKKLIQPAVKEPNNLLYVYLGCNNILKKPCQTHTLTIIIKKNVYQKLLLQIFISNMLTTTTSN